MKLRDHPLMFHEGLRTWPPIWVCVNRKNKPIEHDEIGTLTQVSVRTLRDSWLILWMNNHNGEYFALIYFDDHRFCLEVYEHMKDYVGKPIQDIGDLEFWYGIH